VTVKMSIILEFFLFQINAVLLSLNNFHKNIVFNIDVFRAANQHNDFWRIMWLKMGVILKY